MQIRDDQIEVLFFKQGAGFTNIFCRLYAMIAATQNSPDGFQHRNIVIHQENPSIPS